LVLGLLSWIPQDGIAIAEGKELRKVSLVVVKLQAMWGLFNVFPGKHIYIVSVSPFLSFQLFTTLPFTNLCLVKTFASSTSVHLYISREREREK
jgi:hypothetical protein